MAYAKEMSHDVCDRILILEEKIKLEVENIKSTQESLNTLEGKVNEQLTELSTSINNILIIATKIKYFAYGIAVYIVLSTVGVIETLKGIIV